jgi:hypothetical protein
MLGNVYGNKALFLTHVFTWFKDSDRNLRTLKVISEVGDQYRNKDITKFCEILHAVEPFLRSQLSHNYSMYVTNTCFALLLSIHCSVQDYL